MKNPADIPPEETAPNPKTPDWSGLGDLSGSTLPCPRCNAPQSRVAQRDGSRQWWSCDSYGYGGKVKDQSALCSEREEHNETKRAIARIREDGERTDAAYEIAVGELKRENARLRNALKDVLADEWRVCCDYGPYPERAEILKRAEDILSNDQGKQPPPMKP